MLVLSDSYLVQALHLYMEYVLENTNLLNSDNLCSICNHYHTDNSDLGCYLAKRPYWATWVLTGLVLVFHHLPSVRLSREVKKINFSSKWFEGWMCKPSNRWHWSSLTCHLGNIGQNFHLRPLRPCLKEHSRMTASQPYTRTFWVLGMSVWRWARIERADFVGLRGAQYISSLLRSQLRKQHSSTMPVWGALRMLEP